MNATASDYSEVEGTVQACGPLYQNDATGLEEDAVVQGFAIRTVDVAYRLRPTEADSALADEATRGMMGSDSCIMRTGWHCLYCNRDFLVFSQLV